MAGSETSVMAQGPDRTGQGATLPAPPSQTEQLWPSSVAVKCLLLNGRFRQVRSHGSVRGLILHGQQCSGLRACRGALGTVAPTDCEPGWGFSTAAR